jgi:hypothetical protein
MTERQANAARERGGAVRWGALLVLVSVLGAALGFVRWEQNRELLPGLPVPRYSEIVDVRVDRERGTCTWDLVAEGSEPELETVYHDMLQTRGWSRIGSAGERVNFERDDRVARVAVRIPAAELPGWARIRVNVSPCGEDDVR